MGEMKKILFVANVAKEHINKFHLPTIREFKSQGWRVDVACSADADILDCDNLYDMCWKRSPFTIKTILGIRQLKSILKSNKYDIIYCHTPVGGLVTRLAARDARKKGSKVVYCAHGFHFFKGAPLLNWLLYYPLERLLARLCDSVFTVNKEDYEFAKKNFSPRTDIVLVPEVGVNFDRLKISNPQLIRDKYRKDLNLDDETIALVYVAELVPNKNQIMLVKVLQKLINKGEKVKLILPGPDHSGGELANCIDKLGLSDNVILLGWRSDIGEILSACDICTASSIREGFGINIVEAMYCGLPVVATKNRGHEMIIEDNKNGFLVNQNDYDDMVNKILLLIHNDQIKKKMTNINVDKYDCDTIAKELYEELNRVYCSQN